jgi:hypothetical protein
VLIFLKYPPTSVSFFCSPFHLSSTFSQLIFFLQNGLSLVSYLLPPYIPHSQSTSLTPFPFSSYCYRHDLMKPLHLSRILFPFSMSIILFLSWARSDGTTKILSYFYGQLVSWVLYMHCMYFFLFCVNKII